ncbi:NRDE protein-domain-containing protein [Powellomyces hirtus]|nr:NRDE protein-domain-containing protein [Powellomyces hirtus]
MGTSAKGTITQIGVEQNVVLKSGVQYDRETVTSETPAAAAAVSGVTNEQRKNPTAKDDVDAVSPVSTTTTAAGLAALKTHGSWMGINKRTGHFVFLTNFREHPSLTNPSALTRGYLVRDFLMSDALDAVAYARAVHSDYGKYNGFNLIVGTIDPHQAVPLGYYCGNRSSARDQPSEPLQQGIVYGMSNGVLVNGQSTWPKVERGKLLLQQALDEECADPDALIDNLLRILADKTTYDDSELPPNMYNYQVEKALCPICIDRSRTPNGQYGTLTHTIILVDHQNQARFVEVNRYAVVGPTAADTTSLLAVDEHQNRYFTDRGS